MAASWLHVQNLFKIWNWSDGTARPHSLKMKSIPYGVRFSPDGQYIAVAMEDGVVILNARTAQCIKELLKDVYLRSVARQTGWV